MGIFYPHSLKMQSITEGKCGGGYRSQTSSTSVRLLANRSNTKMEQDAVPGDKLASTSSSEVPFLKDSITVGDRAFKCVSLWRVCPIPLVHFFLLHSHLETRQDWVCSELSSCRIIPYSRHHYSYKGDKVKQVLLLGWCCRSHGRSLFLQF